MRRPRACAAAFAVLCAAFTSAPAPAIDAPELVALSVDGHDRGKLAARVTDRGRMVALAPLARALGWRAARIGSAIALAGDGRTLQLNVGRCDVLESGSDGVPLATPPILRGGEVYVALADVSTIFDVRARAEGRRLVVAASTDQRVQIAEVPRSPPPTQVAVPVPRSVRRTAPVEPTTGTVAVSIYVADGTRWYRVGIDSSGAVLRTNLALAGTAAPAVPTGSVSIGPPRRALTFGANPDPIAGLIIRQNEVDGVGLHVSAAASVASDDVVVARRPGDGRRVVALVRTRGATTRSLSLVTRGDGALDQAVARATTELHPRSGTLVRELLLGTKGAGAGWYVRRGGRTFVEATATATIGKLPLQPNDAPLSFAAGHVLNDAMTVRGGLLGGRGRRIAPFASLFARGRHASASFAAGSRWSSLGVAATGAHGSGELFLANQDGERSLFGRVGWTFGSVALEVHRFTASSQRDTSLEVHAPRGTLTVVAGVEQTG
ncbi:MAG: hypothetical protein JO103_10890, partial [Candidatus Eremiobacteraeota bacterium]|nr:hypothetical protein [Candidatus Eremiobacteraeota bacterium]